MYAIKANGSTIHIDGIGTRTQSTGDDKGGAVAYYAETTCGALTRGRFQTLETGVDLADILAKAQLKARVSRRKMCRNCEKAAGA